MSYKADRVNRELQKSISEIVNYKLKDPRVSEMVSILAVNVAKDLKTAKVIVSIYGDKDKIASTFNALKNCAGFIKKELSTEYKDMRTIPTLTFVLDESAEYSAKINSIIKGLKDNDID